MRLEKCRLILEAINLFLMHYIKTGESLQMKNTCISLFWPIYNHALLSKITNQIYSCISLEFLKFIKRM